MEDVDFEMFTRNFLFISNQISIVLKKKAKQNGWKRYRRSQMYFERKRNFISLTCTISYSTSKGSQKRGLEFQVPKDVFLTIDLEHEIREMFFEYCGKRIDQKSGEERTVCRLNIVGCGERNLDEI